MNSENFPLKSNERDCSIHFLVVSNDYLKALEYAEKTLKHQGYLTYRSVGIVGEKNNVVIIANLLARNLSNDDELACIFSFPKRMQTSTRMVIKRAKKMNGYWKRLALYICFSKGAGEFPIITRRLFNESITSLTIYSLNLVNGEIKELRKEKE